MRLESHGLSSCGVFSLSFVVPCLLIPPYPSRKTACPVCVSAAGKHALCSASFKRLSKGKCCLLVLFCCVWESMLFSCFLECSFSCGFGWFYSFPYGWKAFSSSWMGLPEGLGWRSLVGCFASKQDSSDDSGSCMWVYWKRGSSRVGIPSGQSPGEGGLMLSGDLRNAVCCGFTSLGCRHRYVML